MKRRLTALAMSFLMLLSIVPATRAADAAYFTAVDERVLDLSDATMPFWFGGYLYVAATVFRESGVNYSYNTVKQVLVLYDSSRSLVFDLDTGSATDGQGTLFPHVAVTRGGVTFLPASPVASYFNRTYSNTRVNHGYLVRVRTSSAMSDGIFVDAASYQLESRYQQYQGKDTEVEIPEEIEPAVPDEPHTPDTTSGKLLYLSFLADDAYLVDEWLDALVIYGGHAAFYFTEDALSRCGDQLRRAVAGGHSVGFAVTGGAESVQEQLARMNQRLFLAAGVKTRLVYTEQDTDAAALRAAGYSTLQPRLNRGEYGLTTSKGAATLLRQVRSKKGAVPIWLGENVTAGALRTLLASATEEEDRLLAMTETAR